MTKEVAGELEEDEAIPKEEEDPKEDEDEAWP